MSKTFRKPRLWEALVPMIGMAVIIVYSMLVLGLEPHIPIVLSTILAGLMAWHIGCDWKMIRDGILESNFRALEIGRAHV